MMEWADMTLRLPQAVAIPLAVHGALFLLVVTGILPRAIVPYWTVALALWFVWAPPRDSVLFFAAAIPLFIAIPLTQSFDNFNQWRILSAILFLRWFFTQSRRSLFSALRDWIARPLMRPVASALLLLALFALASLLIAPDKGAALHRIIYFANAALVPIVVYMTARDDRAWRRKLLSAIGWSVVFVTVSAFIQLVMTYLVDVYAFMRIWGEGIQLRQFGSMWSYIAVHLGNTWLAYYGPQLSLRVFSLFPDSHSFPLFTILALGSVIALTLNDILRSAQNGARLRQLVRTRLPISFFLIPFALLAVILSGTRGIWAASLGLLVVLIVVGVRMRLVGVVPWRRRLWQYLGAILGVYILLFAVAWPIFVSPQFLLAKGDWGLLGNRVRSILDFGETSNSQRIAIWSATVQSIAEHPILGVGIGNFPVILSQDVILAKAGSSAHNVWLHVAAETGVFSLLAFTAIWIAALFSAWKLLMRGTGEAVLFGGWMVLALLWAAAYLLTDAALFDGRVLLLFGILVALLRGSDPRISRAAENQ